MDGADCYGFARLVAAAADVFWPLHNDISVSDRRRCEADMAEQIEAYWSPVRHGQERAGDAVHMWSIETGKRLDLHVGVIVRPGRMMHLEEMGGVQAVCLGHTSVERRILGIYRLHGQCDDQAIAIR